MTPSLGAREATIASWTAPSSSIFATPGFAIGSQRIAVVMQSESPGLIVRVGRMSADAEREATSRAVRSRMQKMARIVRAKKAASPRYADRPSSTAEDEELMPGLQKLQATALTDD